MITILEIIDRLVILTIVCWRARSRAICCTARAGNRCIFTRRGPLSLDAPQSTWRTLSFSSWNGLLAWCKSGCRVIALSLMECRGCPSFKACAMDTLRFRTFYPLHACYMAFLLHSAFIMESLYILRYVHFNLKIYSRDDIHWHDNTEHDLWHELSPVLTVSNIYIHFSFNICSALNDSCVISGILVNYMQNN